MEWRIALAGAVLLAGCADATVPVAHPGFGERMLEVDGIVSAYTVWVPPAYDPQSKWPVIVFLHGGGQRGVDGLEPTLVGLGPHLVAAPERWPGIVLFPQIADGEIWQGSPARVAMAALDSAIAEFNVDRSRIYLTGLSMGANGTWYLGYHHPNRFAALVPIAGSATGYPHLPPFVPGSRTESYELIADRVAEVPIWIVHGDADSWFPVTEARKMVDALRSLGGHVRYAELSGVGHWAWDRAYDNPELIAWLFDQRRR